MQVKIEKNHEQVYPDPLSGKGGESVTCVREDIEFPGWIWCVGADSKEGWVHQSFLEALPAGGRGPAVLKEDYQAIELTVKKGDLVEAQREVAGWFWCLAADGRQGWVPADSMPRMA